MNNNNDFFLLKMEFACDAGQATLSKASGLLTVVGAYVCSRAAGHGWVKSMLVID